MTVLTGLSHCLSELQTFLTALQCAMPTSPEPSLPPRKKKMADYMLAHPTCSPLEAYRATKDKGKPAPADRANASAYAKDAALYLAYHRRLNGANARIALNNAHAVSQSPGRAVIRAPIDARATVEPGTGELARPGEYAHPCLKYALPTVEQDLLWLAWMSDNALYDSDKIKARLAYMRITGHDVPKTEGVSEHLLSANRRARQLIGDLPDTATT